MMAVIGTLTTIMIGFAIIAHVLEGSWINSVDVAYFNAIVIFKSMSVFGWFSIPIPNLSFITTGLPRLLDFDNWTTIFTGNAAIISYLLYAFSAFVAFALFIAIVGVVAGRISNPR